MEALKDIFGSDALTFEQFTEKLGGANDGKGIKLADLSDGKYVARDKFSALESEREELKAQLEEASKTIEGFKAMDVDSIKKAADEYKAKAEQAEKEAADKISKMQYRTAAIEAATGLPFSSNSAKNAFINALVEKQLPMEDGKITGFSDFEKAFKESDPAAFKDDTVPPRFVAGTKQPSKESGWREKLAENYQNAKNDTD